MYDEELGRLKKRNVKKKWPHEAKNFTPWLSDNLELLSSALGFNLESPQVEKTAGPYRADILAHNAHDGRRTIIENQLARANLQHLGQLLAYIAHLKARYGVWVATGFNRTIRKAIRMLNRHWPDSTGVFAVKLGLYESGNGHFVPNLEIVEHPAWWNDPIALEFWTSFSSLRQSALAGILDSGSSMRRSRFPIEEAKLRVTQYFGASFVRVYVTGARNEAENDVFPRLNKYRESLNREFDKSELLAGPNPRFTTQCKVNSHERRNWNRMVDWLDNQRMRYERVLRNCL
ncbi:MAG: hypothetical protein F4X14_10830 [Caldilineaceae bacterium SB0661_bin_32]|uniref:DUF4268 domain-containing protein n=1 Tax=Caldilineaceae bacterium SB0661_bin_32 TaxID=2605255 RepID=A0A6B1D7A4_9CHLR|nr:hypothetical protein [Caldilineaceae bacterium SB0661_bin_32]